MGGCVGAPPGGCVMGEKSKRKSVGIAQDSKLSVAYPLDVIRRRMQMVGWKDVALVVAGEGKNIMEYTGMVDAFRKTMHHEGIMKE